MREIKFRGKRIDNGEWVYGFYYEYNYKNYIGSEDHSDNADTYHNNQVDAETVGQYTGLKDKNGKEIYEGDVCKSETNNEVVTVKFGLFSDDDEYPKCKVVGFYTVNQSNDCSSFGMSIKGNMKYIEVIGNIHEPKH